MRRSAQPHRLATSPPQRLRLNRRAVASAELTVESLVSPITGDVGGPRAGAGRSLRQRSRVATDSR
ncbi:hypothetical protein LNP74_32680 [Klebsiella pneumoniae subsp. pneumoniae]|nr:hypothetical protein [Klebsiella pneumoniae subsp. pneumoniae]